MPGSLAAPPHFAAAHLPAPHFSPGLQPKPQPPQLLTSEMGSLHAPPQQRKVAPLHEAPH